MAKPALGRGLGALLGAPAASHRPEPSAISQTRDSERTAIQNGGESVLRIPLERIRPCPLQPRKEFAPAALQELAESIKEQGIIQPLIVRQRDNRYELIAGERRWRAAQLLGLKEVPVVVREADDQAVLELALIENLQRENLNPLEEAQGYAELIERFQLRQEDVAARVGKSRAVVANALRLLKLDAQIQRYIRDGLLSVGHAKVILGLAETREQKRATDQIIKQGLNVRQTEDLIARLQTKTTSSTPSRPILSKDSHVADLENRVREKVGTKVQLRYKQGKGALEIHFYSDDELQRILGILGVQVD